MRSNGGLIGAGNSRKRRVRYPSVSGIWTPNDFVNLKSGGYPQDAKSDLSYYQASDYGTSNITVNGTGDVDTDYNYSDTSFNLSATYALAAQHDFGAGFTGTDGGRIYTPVKSSRGFYIGPPINSQKRVVIGIGYNQGGSLLTPASAVGISTVGVRTESETLRVNCTNVEQYQAADDSGIRMKVAFAYRDVPAMTEYIKDIRVTYNSTFTDTGNNQEGTVLFLYVIEQTGTEEILSVWQTTEIRNSSPPHCSVTTVDPYNGHTILMGTMWSSNATFEWDGNGSQSSGFNLDGKYKSTGVSGSDEAIWQTASRTTTGGGVSTYSFKNINDGEGILTAVCFSTGRDYEAILGSYNNTSGQGVTKYVAPTETITTIPSTSATQYTDDGTSDFLLAVDISNFDHLDDGVIFDLGRGYNVNQGATTNKGISMGMNSGELRVNVGIGNDTFDGVSNTGFDIEISVPSTTMDNYTGEEKITVYFMLDRKVASDPDARIYIQPGGRGSTRVATLVGSSNDVVPSELWTASYGYPGYGGKSSDSVSGPADLNFTGNVYTVDYEGNITGMRVWINEANLRTKEKFLSLIDVSAASL